MVICVVKTSLDVFSLTLEYVLTLDLGDYSCGMKRVTESGQQGLKT